MSREAVIARANELAQAGRVDDARALLAAFAEQQKQAAPAPKPTGPYKAPVQPSPDQPVQFDTQPFWDTMKQFRRGATFGLWRDDEGEQRLKDAGMEGVVTGANIAGGISTGGLAAAKVLGTQGIKNAPLLARAGASVGVGAAEGGLVGGAYSEAEDSAGMYEDIGSGMAWGAGGGFLGPIFSRLGRGARTMSGFGGEERAMGRIGELLKSTGLSPEEIAGRLNKLGPGATLGDLDRWMTAELREALSQSTPEARAALDFLERRLTTGRERIGGSLKEAIDAPYTSKEVRAMNASDQIDAARPMYEEAMETVVDAGKYPALKRLLQFKPIQDAIAAARKSLSYSDEPAGAFKILHVAKTKLDDQIAYAKRNGFDSEARDLINLKNQLLTQMDDMAADQGYNYAEARKFWADASARERALETGESLFRGRKSISEVEDQLAGMSLAERQSFLSGASEAAMEQLAYSSVKDPAKIFNAKNTALLRQIIPDDGDFQRLLSTIEGESQKMISGQVAGGKVAMDQGILHGLGALVYGAAGNLNALAAVALNKIGTALSGMSNAQRAEAIKILTQTGIGPDEIEEIMRFSNRGVLDAATKGVTIAGGAMTGGALSEEE